MNLIQPRAKAAIKATVKGYTYDDDLKRTTDDGLTWLDPEGNPPSVDEHGRLTAPFVLLDAFGRREGWAVGTTLPMPPGVFKAIRERLEAAREAAKKKERNVTQEEQAAIITATKRELMEGK